MAIPNEPNRPTCTWCHGTGYIRRATAPSANKVAWLVLFGFILFVLITSSIGRLTGWAAVAALLFLVALFAVQGIAEFRDMLADLFGRKEKCPHCGGNRGLY